MDLNHEGKYHQPRPKAKLTSSYPYAKSQPNRNIVSSSLAQYMHREHAKVSDEQAQGVRVQTTEDDVERLPQSDDD